MPKVSLSRFIPAVLLLAYATMASCSGQPAGQSSPAVPRPVAFPRPALHDSTFTLPEAFPVPLKINAEAIVSYPKGSPEASPDGRRTLWADITYPLYGATIHCTFTPVDASNKSAVTDNRLQRMALNIPDGAEAEQTDIAGRSGRYLTLLLEARSPSVTPLQFLSVGPDWIVSGAVRYDDASRPSSADSVAPVIDALRRDLIHAANCLP